MAWGSQVLSPKDGPQPPVQGDSRPSTPDRGSLPSEEPLLEKRIDPTCSSFDSLPVPPDGGYGWVVCGAAFMCMIILDGMMFSFGVFFLDLLDSFGESKGKTSWVGSTLMGTHLIMGPMTAVLVNLYDCRRVALVGCVIATIAFATSTFSPSLNVLILLYGFAGGVGVSMIYIPAILIVGFYFEKRRALANGIANSGSGLGTFIYAPLSRLLLDEFSWRGGLLLLSGLVANCAVCAALFRPLVSSRSPSPPWPADEEESVVVHPAHGDRLAVLSAAGAANDGLVKAKSQGDLPSTTLSGTLVKRAPPANSHLVYLSSVSLRTPRAAKKLPTLPKKKFYVSKEMLHNPLARKDAFYSGSIHRLDPYTDPDVPFSLSMLRLPTPRDDDDVSETVDGQSVSELLHNILGLSLLRSPSFLMCVFSGVLWTTHSSVLSILPDYAVLCGFARPQAALLVSIIGITNIVGRLLAGFVSDRPGVDPVWVNAAALLTGSAVTFTIPFTTNYIGMGLEAGVFGLCMGAWTSLRPIILVELLGLDRLTNAFGLMAMFQGIAFTVGSPITGTLFDCTQSYRVPFLVAGCAFLMSGVASLLMRRVSHCELRHDRDDMDMDI